MSWLIIIFVCPRDPDSSDEFELLTPFVLLFLAPHTRRLFAHFFLIKVKEAAFSYVGGSPKKEPRKKRGSRHAETGVLFRSFGRGIQ
jgi:hypothetical protein